MKCAVLAMLLASQLFAEDEFIPASFAGQQIGGILGERMRVNLEGRLLRLDESHVLAGFLKRPGDHPWIGEHAGKFLDAAANTWLYTHDARLKTLMDRVAGELMSAQLPDGYLGTYADKDRWTQWDVWVHKYDLIGLLAYHKATGNARALETSRRIGDLLCRTFGPQPGQKDIIAVGTHVGMAATSVLEPMVKLYRVTANPKYLAFCKYLVHSWQQTNGPKIISSLLETRSVFHTANAKAYEMLSNLVGLIELYRVTGENEYRKAVEIAWTDVVSHRLYVTGTTSASEHFADDFVLPGEDISEVGEGCVTVTWLQLSWQLLRLTGEAKYGHEIERTVYNALLGSQDPATGDICYFTPLNGKKSPSPGISCCVSSEPRGISMIPELAWGSLHGGVTVILYAPGHFTEGSTRIEVKTSFPLDGAATVTIHPEKASRFPLYLRVPQWTAGLTASVDGRQYKGTPGQFLEIDRQWRRGDEVHVNMDMTVRLLPGGPSYPHSGAVLRGPQVLALEKAVNPGLLDLQTAGPTSGSVHLTDAKLPSKWSGSQAYRLEGKPRALLLVPYADARAYRVWLSAP
jgi:DUF1680 family protein